MGKFFIYTLGISNNIEKWRESYDHIISLVPFDSVYIIHSDIDCVTKETTNQKILFNDLRSSKIKCTSFTIKPLDFNNLESPNIIIDMNIQMNNTITQYQRYHDMQSPINKLNIIYFDEKIIKSKIFIYDEKVITYVDKIRKLNLCFNNPNLYIKKILEKSKENIYIYWNKKKENDNFFIKLLDFMTFENNKIEEIMNDKLLIKIVNLIMKDKDEYYIINQLDKYGKHIVDLLFNTIEDESICTKND